MNTFAVHRLLFCFLYGVLFCGQAWATMKNYTDYRLLQVQPDTESQLSVLRNLQKQYVWDIDFWVPPTKVNKSVEFLVTPKKYFKVKTTLIKAGLDASVLSRNIQSDMEEEKGSTNMLLYSKRSITDTYATYEEIVNLLKGYKKYSHVQVKTYGKSYLSQELFAIKFSTGAGRKTIIVEAGMHCREWIAIASTLKIIERMATECNSDPEITALLNKYDWLFVPVINPDGYEVTHKMDRLWRKNVKPSSRNCFGTDLNRNFDANWGGEGASPDPCDNTYHGERAFSEPETVAFSKLVRSTRNKIAFFSVHAYSQYILTPYGCTHKKPSDTKELTYLANQAARAIYDATERRFVVGTPPDILYIATGGAYDWAKMKMNIKYSYAFELRPDSRNHMGFIMPKSNIGPSSKELFVALKTFAEGFKN